MANIKPILEYSEYLRREHYRPDFVARKEGKICQAAL
jgi:hypothetical protein